MTRELLINPISRDSLDYARTALQTKMNIIKTNPIFKDTSDDYAVSPFTNAILTMCDMCIVPSYNPETHPDYFNLNIVGVVKLFENILNDPELHRHIREERDIIDTLDKFIIHSTKLLPADIFQTQQAVKKRVSFTGEAIAAKNARNGTPRQIPRGTTTEYEDEREARRSDRTKPLQHTKEEIADLERRTEHSEMTEKQTNLNKANYSNAKWDRRSVAAARNADDAREASTMVEKIAQRGATPPNGMQK